MAFDVEQFFQSIDVILTQRLNDLSYDKTIIATIINDSDKENGHYVVSDGAIKFDAYANDLNYKIDDQVRITVLNGDWSQKKFIAGKYSDKENNNVPLSYKPPLSTTMLDSQSSLSTITSWTFTTNNSNHLQTLWTKRITSDDKYYALQTNGIYNTITISADFNTNFDAISGNYGLLLELYISPSKNSTERIRKFMTLDSSEMLGNPYSYRVDTRQSKQVVIALDEGIITEIILYAYQANIFEVSEGVMVQINNPFIDRNQNELDNKNNKIFYKNIQLGFGSDLTQIEDNSLKIYTTDSATYHYNNGVGDESNNKSIGLVWYNKSDDDEYIGFSDGVIGVTNNTIDTYDEIDYLLEQYADVRLLQHKGKVGIPTDALSLKYAADIAESEPHFTKAYQSLTGKNGASSDLVQNLQSVARAVAGTTLETSVSQLISAYTSNGSTKDAKLVEYANKAEIAAQRLINKYRNILHYGYEIQNGMSHKLNWTDCSKPKEPVSNLVSATNTSTYLNTFNTQISNAIRDVRSFLTSMQADTQPSKPLAGFRGIYDIYAPKIEAAIANIELECSQIVVTAADESNLSKYQNWTMGHYEPYAEKDLSHYDNKYCIYWYRYNPKFKLEYTEPLSESEFNSNTTLKNQYNDYQHYTLSINKEYKFGQFLGPNWERVQVDKDNNHIYNIGLPTTIGDSKQIKDNGVLKTIYYFPPSPEETQLLKRKMDPCTAEERYQAVLFYNHVQVNSNVITFINSEADKIPAEFAVDANDKLVISHGADSQDHYQSYTSAFDLVNIADESKGRDLRVSYDGIFSGDEALANAGIYWYIPTDATMLTYDKKHLVNDLGFTTDADHATEYSKAGYIYFYKQIKYTSVQEDAKDVNGNTIYNADGTAAKNSVITLTEADRHFEYKIKPFYDPGAQNNTILVEAHIQGKNGNSKITSGEIFFTFSTFGSNGTKYTFTITPTSATQVALSPSSTGENSGRLLLNLALRDSENKLIPISSDYTTLKTTETTADPPIDTYGLTVGWRTHYDNKPSTGVAVSEIADSDMKQITLASAVHSTYKYAGILEAKVSYTTTGKNENSNRTITLNALYPVAYTTNPNYFISGPTVIVYNNQGVLSRLSEDPFVLYNRYELNSATGEYDSNVKVQGQTWSLVYFDNQGKELSTLDAVDTAAIMNYMPSLNSDNTIMPAPMYYQYDNNKFYVPVAICRVDGNIVWTQPIIITQNQYASSTLNDWNGEFQINEANGTILSTMIGAGKKTSNNTFEGILMGDINAGANFDTYNANGIGLYGFNDGAQSFYFGVDGTAFLGKSTSGRIKFDGNDGFIYSQKWLNSFEKNEDGSYVVNPFTTQNGIKQLSAGKDGLAIDLQNGHIDAYDFKITSKNIYLNSTPDSNTDYYFRIGNNGRALPKSYDDLHDVEPQLTNGYMAMTKGGDLEIRANSLSLTGQLGGVNLLKQTAPQRSVPIMTKITTEVDGATSTKTVPMTLTDGTPVFDWNVAIESSYTTYSTYCSTNGMEPLSRTEWEKLPALAWKVGASNGTTQQNNIYLAGSYPNETYDESNARYKKEFYLAITNNVDNERRIYQEITNITGGEYYTLSGYVNSLLNLTDKQTLTITIDANGGTIEVPLWSGPNEIEFINSQWTYFSHTFKIPAGKTSFKVGFNSTSDYALWHLKLENGSIATEWTPAPEDTEDIVAAESKKYDIYLTQERIFDKLTTDENGNRMVGIWILDDAESSSGRSELYINATYLASGVLRSTNWNGTIRKDLVTVNNVQQCDKYRNPLYTYNIATYPSDEEAQGVYFDLNRGKLWAAKFQLDATRGTLGTDNPTGLYLNSHIETNTGGTQSSGRWLFLGDGNNYIDFGRTSASNSYLKLKVQNNFTLQTTGLNAIYLSNEPTPIEKITGQETTDKYVLAIGTKFAVTDKGKLYIEGARVNGEIYAKSGEIGGWNIGTNTLTSIGTTSGTETPLITLNGATGTISGGTVTGAIFTSGTMHGSKILGGTLDIGGTLNASSNSGSGNFSVDSNGNIHIGSKRSDGTYNFSVTNQGALTAQSAVIGGWRVTETKIQSGATGGICLTSGANGGITSSNWKTTASGATEFKNLVVSNSFYVLKNTFNGATNTVTTPSTSNTVFGVTNTGNVNFTGTITLGPQQKTGLTSAADTGKAPANGDGYITLKVDTPWENGTAYMTFYNGILCGYHYESGTAANFFDWLLGDDKSNNGIGSATRPVYVKEGGKVTPMARGAAGDLFMGQGTLKDPAWTTVTGFTNDRANSKFGLSRDTTNNKFYVQIPAFIGAGSSAATGLVPKPGATAGTMTAKTLKVLTENGQWTTLGDLAYVDDIKKKFKVTMTASNPSGIYTTDNGTTTYTGATVTSACDVDWDYEYWYDSAGNRERLKVYYGHDFDYNITYKGEKKRYERTAVTSITLEGTSSDITLDASSSTSTNPIAITITGATKK